MRLVLRLAAGLGLAVLASGLALGASAASDVRGHVYVNDNTAGTNSIAAFDRHPDGSLSPTAGSPFAAGGAGTGTIVGSQGSLQLSADGRYLLAADAGSSEISVLR
ncbi:MAG TPA: 3-carboxymuconate cyclase, partial [Candidatus Dormibacteraeota bacterium]